MRICLIVLFLFNVFVSQAQDSTLQFSAGILLSGSTNQTPFWIASRQHGIVPKNGSFGLGQFTLNKHYHPNNPRNVQWSGKLEAIASYGKKGDLFISEIYLAGKLGPLELLAGQQRYTSGLVMDSTLTSGALAMSGNARPYPKVQLSMPEFYPLAFTGDFLSFKASYSDGRLRDSHIVYGQTSSAQETFFHQKSLYLKFGQPQRRLHTYLGINHQVVWGGEKEIDPLYALNRSTAYWHSMTGKKLDAKIIGNHFGTLDLGGSWRQNDWTYSIYRQNIYETGSLFKVINFKDGLNGLSVKRNKPLPAGSSYFAIHSAVLEVVGTKNQQNANPALGLGIYQYGNYFNHYIYQNGWSYRGNNIGTPLVPAKEDTRGNLPHSTNTFTNNNRLWAIHSGVTASWLNLQFLFKGTHTFNYGTHLAEFTSVKQQTSLFLSAQKQLDFWGGSNVTIGLSSDFGSLLPESYGFVLGFKKSMMLN